MQEQAVMFIPEIQVEEETTIIRDGVVYLRADVVMTTIQDCINQDSGVVPLSVTAIMRKFQGI